MGIVCYTDVFSVVTQPTTPQTSWGERCVTTLKRLCSRLQWGGTVKVYRSGVKMTGMRSKGWISENPNKTTGPWLVALIAGLKCCSLYRWRNSPLFTGEWIVYELDRSNRQIDHTAEITTCMHVFKEITKVKELICPLMKNDASFPQETTRPSETFNCNKVLTSPRVLRVAHFSRLERKFIGMCRKNAQ